MKIDIELTQEQRDAEPNFESTLACFQRECDDVERNIREKFRLCLHEGAHAMQYRRRSCDVVFHGPCFYYNSTTKKVKSALGGVSPVRGEFFADWEEAAISVAGFVILERLTGMPNEEEVINNDLDSLKRKLEVSPRLPYEPEILEERFDRAKFSGQFMILCELEEPTFFPELETATRDYEKEIFHTDEAWVWGWNQYRLDLTGKRHAVGHSCLGFLGLLIDGNGELTLVVDGKAYCPSDKINGYNLELFASRVGGEQATDAVRRWNELVRATTTANREEETK